MTDTAQARTTTTVRVRHATARRLLELGISMAPDRRRLTAEQVIIAALDAYQPAKPRAVQPLRKGRRPRSS